MIPTSLPLLMGIMVVASWDEILKKNDKCMLVG